MDRKKRRERKISCT